MALIMANIIFSIPTFPVSNPTSTLHKQSGHITWHNMLPQSVNIKNPCAIYYNTSTGPYLEGAGITSEKTQFPAHLYKNRRHNLTYQNRLTDVLSQDSP